MSACSPFFVVGAKAGMGAGGEQGCVPAFTRAPPPPAPQPACPARFARAAKPLAGKMTKGVNNGLNNVLIR